MMFHFRIMRDSRNISVTSRSDTLTLEPMPLPLISLLGGCTSMAKLLISKLNWNDYHRL